LVQIDAQLKDMDFPAPGRMANFGLHRRPQTSFKIVVAYPEEDEAQKQHISTTSDHPGAFFRDRLKTRKE
jgi:hypothetical protein